MSTFYLINTTYAGTQKYFAGHLVDDSVDPASTLRAAGGVLWPSADTVVAAAAAIANSLRTNKSVNEDVCDKIMAAAAASTAQNPTNPAYNPDHAAPGDALGDSAPTINASQGNWRILPAATLTADRIVTLLDPADTTHPAPAGTEILITRVDATAHVLTIANGGVGGGNVAVLPASKANFTLAHSDGTNWLLKELGTQ